MPKKQCHCQNHLYPLLMDNPLQDRWLDVTNSPKIRTFHKGNRYNWELFLLRLLTRLISEIGELDNKLGLITRVWWTVHNKSK